MSKNYSKTPYVESHSEAQGLLLRRVGRELLPPPKRKFTDKSLHQIVRMLALVNSSKERRIVHRHFYCGCDLQTVADELRETTARVQEVITSLKLRLRIAQRFSAAEYRINRMTSLKTPKRGAPDADEQSIDESGD